MSAGEPASYWLLGVAMAVLAAPVFLKRNRESGFWFAVLVVGQAAWLSLIDAGKAVHFEHLRIAMVLRGEAPLALAEVALHGVLVLHLLIVAVGLYARRRRFSEWLPRLAGRWRTAVLVGMAIGIGTFPSPVPIAFALESVVALLLRAAALGCVLLLASAVADETINGCQRVTARLLGASSTIRDGRQDAAGRLVLGCAAATIGLAAALAWFSYERHPHVPDEVAYVFQARYFAEGRLGAPAPRVPEAFETYLIECDSERCTSPFPPGWPAVLAAGVAAGLPWLVNPMLAGLNVILLFLLVRQVWDGPTARLSVLLLTLSPMHVFMAMSFMSHTLSLSCALVAANCVALMVSRSQARWGVPAGIAIGLISLIRPLEAAVAAGVLGAAALAARGPGFRYSPALVLGSAALAVGLTNIPYNQLMTGQALTFPVDAYMNAYLGDGAGTLGFGPHKGATWEGLDPFPGHGLRDVIVNTQVNLTSLNIELFGWSIGSLLPVAWLIIAGRVRRMDGWLLLWIGGVGAAQSLYWFSGGPDFGARYWFTVLVPLVILTARAIGELGQARKAQHDMTASKVLVGAAALSASAFLTFVPWRAIDKYHEFRGMRPDFRELLAERDFTGAVILVRGESNPDFASAMVYAPVAPESGGPVVLHDLNPQTRARIAASYADHQFWIVDGPSRTDNGYQIAAGPIEAGDLEVVASLTLADAASQEPDRLRPLPAHRR